MIVILSIFLYHFDDVFTYLSHISTRTKSFYAEYIIIYLVTYATTHFVYQYFYQLLLHVTYRVMGLYRLSKTCYFAFFVVLLHSLL